MELFLVRQQNSTCTNACGEIPQNSLEDVLSYFDEVGLQNNAEMHQIHFYEKFPPNSHRLMQVTKHIAESIAIGEKVVFRGRNEDSVVLCTKSKTYSVKEVETSNTMLILPTLSATKDVVNTGGKMSIVPMSVLRQMLHMRELQWEWIESSVDESNIYSLEDIRSVVQLSDKELSRALNKMPVVKHKGKIRWLSNDLQDKLLDLIVDAFDNVQQPYINLTHLTVQALRSVLPENITDAIIEWFLCTMCRETENGDYDVDPYALSRARAAQLLRSAPRFEIHDFHKRADALMPVGISLNPSAVSGISVQYGNARTSYISYMSTDELPDDPRERMKILFSKQNQWKSEEVMPFFSDICEKSYEIELLLMDMCNSTQLRDGTTVYCSLRRI